MSLALCSGSAHVVSRRTHKQDATLIAALITLAIALIAGVLGLLWKLVQGLAWCFMRIVRSRTPVSTSTPVADQRTLAEILAHKKSGTISGSAPASAPTMPVSLKKVAASAAAQPAAIEPVVVQRAVPIAPSAAIPPAPASSKPTWIGFDDHAALARWKMPRGGIYIGTPSNAPGDAWRAEPALIDPSLPIDAGHVDFPGQSMGYWPSYRTIKPNERATYLAYLHSDRVRPEVGLGYVFLYFYGLERRLLMDACDDAVARSEAPAILSEIDRLLAAYGPISRSFQHYATDLRDLGAALYGTPKEPEVTGAQGQPSAGLLIQMAKVLGDGQPMPAALAFAWAASAPTAPRWYEWRNIEPEVRALFSEKYQQMFGGGIQSAKTSGVLKLHLHGAASNRSSMTMSLNIADPRSIEPRLGRLPAILTSVVSELDALRSQRNRRKDPLAEALALPASLRAKALPAVLDGLKQFAAVAVRDRAGVVNVADLRQHGGWTPGDKFAKREAVSCAQALEIVGFGLEPDVRFGGLIGKSVVLFALDHSADNKPATVYAAAVGVLNLAFAMANADGVVTADEVQACLDHVGALFSLKACDRLRLKARLQLLQLFPPSMTRLLGSARRLASEEREAVAGMVIGIAHADGRVDPTEVKLLERIYKALDLDPARVPSDLHRFATQSTLTTRPAGHGLDATVIAAKMKETEAVQNLLGRIFAEADAAGAPPPAVVPAPPQTSRMGLNAAHSALVEQVLALASKSVARAQWEAWCEPLGVMPDGAVETINDAAFDAFGGSLLSDEGDNLEIEAGVCESLRESKKEVAHA
jgi:uncharacterized tellurite resistance protein B-like protein